MMLPIEVPFHQYADLDGKPLDNGYLYFGPAGQNPETTPITVYWDAAGTQPAAQPIRTTGGYAMRSGTPAALYCAVEYSLTVRNSALALVFYAATCGNLAAPSGAAQIGFAPGASGPQGATVQAALQAAAESGVNNSITALGGLATAIGGTRNRIINGNFAINQRGVSGTIVLTAGQYGHDRWKAGASGCTYTISAAGIVTISAGSLMQVIEGANVEGGQYVVNNGGGSAQMRVAINGAATSGAYASGPVITSAATAGQNITVEFTTGTVGLVQLEPGTTASQFERRFIQTELALCKRYYNIVPASWRGQSVLAAAEVDASIFWPDMRATPTVTYANGSGYVGANISSDVLIPYGPSGGRWALTVASANGDSFILNRLFNLSAEL
jgi:hypothetical protein